MSSEELTFRTMKPGEEQAVCRLVKRVFDECVKEEYETEGVREFFRFANPSAMAARVQAGSLVLVAVSQQALVGMLELMPPDRVALLFVILRGRGVAKLLVNETIRWVRASNPNLSKLTVHSSRCAEPFYRKMGFHRVGNITKDHGITFIPMELNL